MIEKNSKGIKGYSDIEAGQRSHFSERSQNIMNDAMNKLSKILKDKDCKLLWEANNVLFIAPTFVYITIPKKELNIVFLIQVL